MASSPRDALSKLLGEIIQWRVMFPEEVRFKWNESHLSVVRDYILKLDLIPQCRAVRAAKVLNEPHWYEKRQSIRHYLPKVTSFTQELQEFLIVPRPHWIFDQQNTLKKKELVAAFINFLLQLLSHKTDLIDPLEDQMDSLEKDLRFLFAVLGDVSLLQDELEQVQSLLADFEAVANEAGRLVHSFFFSRDLSFRTMKEGLDHLFNHIGRLKDDIIQLSTTLPPSISRANITSQMADVDSLFIVDSFLYDLEDVLNQDDSLITVDVKRQVQELHQKLVPSVSFLKDIKMTRHSEIEGLKEAEAQIRDVAYEAEYLINSFLVGDAPPRYISNRLSRVIHKSTLVGSQLQEIEMQDHISALEVGDHLTAQLPARENKNSEVDDFIVGFEENAMDILDQLVGETQNVQIISIYGMPGLGKTTIAKQLYNHPTVRHRFDRCLWCVVSQTYQRRDILIDILISLTSEFDKARILNMGEERLGVLIYQSLKGRRYLIVMDDIWDSKAWYDLWSFFPDDENGSRILFTSRYEEVAPPGSKIYPLPPLTDEQCWELLRKKVFQNEDCPHELEGIGMHIAASCGGLPLTVVVVAGILSTLDKEESKWRKVGEDLASYIFDGGENMTKKFDGGENMMKILGLSYKHLPEHLKPCFLYFGAFPEDTEIPARKLMRLWIAEGFVRKEPRKSSEVIAEEYLMELIEKSLVIVAKRRTNGGVKACLIHDVRRVFCLRICEGENFLKFVGNNYSIYEKGQRLLSLQRSVTPFGQHVRSFYGYLLDSPFYVLNMRLLRVLDFKRMLSQASLIGIEYLIHLRYLVINELSASIGKLVNLEYLRVENNGTVRIPSVILKLVKLRHLQINRQATFEEECSSSQTNNLEVLSNIIIKKQKDEEILKCSPHLRKLKCTCQPSSEGRGEDRYLDLQMFTQLESLNVKFYRHRMGEISFPSNVKKLTLSGLCLPWEKMGIIGTLQHLEVLKLGSGAFVGETWETSDSEFQQLRFLKMQILDLAQWEVDWWDHFPRLERLVLYYCRNLQEIPAQIGHIATLQVIEVQLCSEAVEQSAIRIQQEQRDLGNEDLRIIFSHV